MNSPQTSIIIRCLNEDKHIGTLLTALQKQSYKNFEVILVDSGSTDATLDIAKKYDGKILHIHPDKFSFGASLNLGCEAAKGEFLVMISAHVYPANSHWLETLLKGFDDPSVGVVYGKQRGNEITRFSEHQIFEKWFPDESKPRQKGPFCNNANCAVRTSLWAKLKYDEQLTGLEDIDFAKRAIEYGNQVRYAKNSTAVHVHDETYPHIANRYRREAIALQKIFPNEHFGVGDLMKFWIVNSVSDFRAAFRQGCFWKEWLGIIRFRWAQFFGTYRGFHLRKALDSHLKQHLYYPND